MTEMNPLPDIDIEHTSTVALARALHHASWAHNPGRMIVDIPVFDALPEADKFHLVEVAYAAECLLDQYDHEEEKLLLWNLAEILYRAYVGHPASDIPNLPWESAPTDVGILWYRYAEGVLKRWREVKSLPRHKGWLNVKVRKE